MHIDKDSIYDYAVYMKKHGEILPKLKLASVVNSKVHYGIVRMWEMLVECTGIPIDHKVFKDMEEARNWLISSEK